MTRRDARRRRSGRTEPGTGVELFWIPLGLLDQSPPSLTGFAVAVVAIPAVVAADTAHKTAIRRRRLPAEVPSGSAN